MDNCWSFFVFGLPAPQGSKRHVGGGVMVESSKKVVPWREAVKAAAPAVGRPLDGPLGVVMVFTLARPKAAPKYRTLPDRYPDLSKLCRATEDAITEAGLWADDARVAEYLVLAKVWTGHSRHGDVHLDLPVPGALVAAIELDGVGAAVDVIDAAVRIRQRAWYRAGRALA